VTRREFAIKRLIPVAMLTAIALIANDTCHKSDRTHGTLELDFGAERARVRSVQAEVVVDGDVVGELRRVAQPGMILGPTVLVLALPAQDATVRVTVDVGAGEVALPERSIHVEEDATVTLSLARDLPASP
jgi:hypothetical protein